MACRSRTAWLLLPTAAVVCGSLALAATHPRDLVLYNHSPSLPTGLYLRRSTPIERGAIVTVRAVDVAPVEAAARHFEEDGNRFIKRVAATAGDKVCAQDNAVRVNGRIVARWRAHDTAGIALSTWTGCRLLMPKELFLLGDTEDSFDGRYWGPTSRDKIEGVWIPLSF